LKGRIGMKTIVSILFLAFALNINAQTSNQADFPQIYTTSGGELIFSTATDVEGALRFSPLFNIQNFLNYDLSHAFGLFSGWSLRNIGFIYEVPDEIVDDVNLEIRKKFRTYNIGIPVGFKLGDLNDLFLYGGYELEIPFHYKEKTFVNGDKNRKKSDWFSGKISPFQHSILLGVQLPHGMNIKFKYYFTDFFYEHEVMALNNSESRHQNFYYYPTLINVFYFSFSFCLFTNDKFTIDDPFNFTQRAQR